MAPSSKWALAKSAGAGLVIGCSIYAATDVVGDYTTFSALRDRALLLADANQALKDQIGAPFTPGEWYNSSIGYAMGGKIAQTTFQLKGQRQITDVTVRAVRNKGYVHNGLYNLLGSGEWKVMECNAMFPAGGGRVEPRTLFNTDDLAENDKLLGQAGSGGSSGQPGEAAGECKECVAKQQQPAQQQQAVAPAGPGADAGAKQAGEQQGASRKWYRLWLW